MNTLFLRALFAAVALAPPSVVAQAGAKPPDIPPAYMPPPGLCRIWVNGVPPAKQPAPTECAKALQNQPSNARVIFGELKAPPKNGTPKTKPDSGTVKRDTSRAKRDTVSTATSPAK